MNRYSKPFFALTTILVGAVTCLIYWSGLHGPFVFDDISNIALVPAMYVTHLDFDSLWNAAFWQKSTGVGRPLAMLSFALNYYFGGFDTFYLKLTNLVIHLCNGALLYWLSLRLLKRLHPKSEDPFTPYHLQWVALAVTALWLVHPLNLTSVLYVVQRMTSLATLFILLGLAGYIIGREHILRGKSHGLITIIASLIVCGSLAFLSKENGVLLPLYMLVIEIIFYRFEAVAPLKKKLVMLWTAIFVVPAALFIVLLVARPSSLSALFNYQHRDFSLMDRLLTEPRALWFYLNLITIPNIREMGVYHDDFITSRGLLDPPATIQAIIGIAGLLVLAVLTVRRLPMLSFALAWFLAGHVLESTFVPLELVHEHRNYLPQYSILFGIAYYLVYPYAYLRRSLALRRSLIVLYFALFASATYARSLDWRDEWTLYNRDVVNHPESSRSHTMLGILLQDNKQYAMAEGHFRKAVELKPNDSMAIIRLAQHYYGATRAIPESVMRDLEYGLMHYPYSGITIWTYGPLLHDTLKDKKLNQRVIQLYENFILRPDFHLDDGWREVGFQTLGFTYRQRKDYQKAAYYFNKALALNPLPRYYLILAGIYKEQGNLKTARQTLSHLDDQYALLNTEDKTAYDILNKELNIGP